MTSLFLFKFNRNVQAVRGILRILQKSLKQTPSRTSTVIKNRLLPVSVVSIPVSLLSMRLAAALFESKDKNDPKLLKKLIIEVDQYYDCSDYIKIIELLRPHREHDNDEVLWRLSRALYKQSQTLPKSAAERVNLCAESYECLQRALAINENNFNTHRWMSIVLDEHSRNKGTKEVLEQSYVIKNHMLKAIELNPKDATSYFLVGYWCYAVAELPWYQRKIAAAIFGKPPESSFDEALGFFQKAEEMAPYFYSKNLLMLGRTYWQLGDNDKAAVFAKRAKEYVPKNHEDREVHEDAIALLKKLGVNE